VRKPRARRSPLEGGGDPRARQTLLEGAPCWAALVGCGGHRGVGCAVCICFVLDPRLGLCFGVFLQVLSMIPPDFLGTLMAVPDSSPRAFAGVPARFPQMLEPTDRTLFPTGCKCLSMGMRQRTRGSSP
jgi:hypothetical protein